MASISRHPGDIFEWIKKVIKSCKTKDHLDSVNNLIDNFVKNCGDTVTVANMRSDLLMLVNKQIDVINNLT